MPFAILQSTLDIPSVDSLRNAFRSVQCLTDIDAFTLGRDAYGILVKNLSSQDAAALQGALKVEGVETDIVDQQLLPPIPQGRVVHRLDCLPDALRVYDPVGRTFPVDWSHIMLIAAGQVKVSEFERIERKVPGTIRRDLYGNPDPYEPPVEYFTRERQLDRCLLEIVLTQGVLRYSAQARKFNFQYLKDRKARDPIHNFKLVVSDLLSHAPRAIMNRGAYFIREQADELFSYPSKNAFLEEMTWILWRAKNAA